MRRPAKKGRYHHGDLPSALIDTAIELINERGLAGFSLAEASRRLGVTVAAPYRHFTDRDELLAAVAVRASGALAGEVSAQVRPDDTAAGQLAAVAECYVRFAVAQRPLFQALFAANLDKTRHPELAAAAEPMTELIMRPALLVCGGDADAARELSLAVGAVAHGFAMMLLDGTFGPAEAGVDQVAARAANAVRTYAVNWPTVHAAPTEAPNPATAEPRAATARPGVAAGAHDGDAEVSGVATELPAVSPEPR